MARSSIFRKTLSSTMLCACIAVVLYELGVFAFGLLFQNTSLLRGVRFAVTSILSLLTFPILYPLTTAIENITAVGQVKLNGMEWTARSTSGEPIPAGTIVKVDRIEGVKAFVSPVKEAVEC